MRTILLSLGILLLMSTVEGFKVTAKKNGDGVDLACEAESGHSLQWKKDGVEYGEPNATSIKLVFGDDQSGEYECFSFKEDITYGNSMGIYHVKFRTGANTIELEVIALVGIIVSNIVATILIGVSVYCIASQSKGPAFPSNKASQESDRRNLLPQGGGDVYQALSPTGRAGEYDVLHNRRR